MQVVSLHCAPAQPARCDVPAFLNGAEPSSLCSERCSARAGLFGAATSAGRGQYAAPGARSARTNGVEAVPWSTQTVVAGVVGYVVVGIGFRLVDASETARRLPGIPS